MEKVVNDKKIVHTRKVECEGGTGALGHPLVYLHIKEPEGKVVCPYCSKNFIYVDPDKTK